MKAGSGSGKNYNKIVYNCGHRKEIILRQVVQKVLTCIFK